MILLARIFFSDVVNIKLKLSDLLLSFNVRENMKILIYFESLKMENSRSECSFHSKVFSYLVFFYFSKEVFNWKEEFDNEVSVNFHDNQRHCLSFKIDIVNANFPANFPNH